MPTEMPRLHVGNNDQVACQHYSHVPRRSFVQGRYAISNRRTVVFVLEYYGIRGLQYFGSVSNFDTGLRAGTGENKNAYVQYTCIHYY